MLLEAKFTNIQQEPNKSFKSFSVRYNKLVHLLQLHNVNTPTCPKIVAYKFISALNHPILHERVLINFDKNTEWHLSSPAHLSQVAQKFIDSVNNIIGKSKQNKLNPNQDKKENQNQQTNNTPAHHHQHHNQQNDPNSDCCRISAEEQVKIDSIIQTLFELQITKQAFNISKQLMHTCSAVSQQREYVLNSIVMKLGKKLLALQPTMHHHHQECLQHLHQPTLTI